MSKQRTHPCLSDNPSAKKKKKPSETTLVAETSNKPGSFYNFCTYNVHLFATKQWVDNRDMVKKYLTGNDLPQIGCNLDLIALNESYKKRTQKGVIKQPLKEICEHLNKGLKRGEAKYQFYFALSRRIEGNSIITRLPVLRDGRQLLTKGEGGPRNVLGIEIDRSSCSCPVDYVFVTHLDHIQESMRIQQMFNVVTFMKTFMKLDNNTNTIPNFVLMGDLNAMRKDDYSETFWRALESKRRENKWESVETRLMNSILGISKDDDLGLGHLSPLIDTYKQCHPDHVFEGDKNTGTSQVDTRIDYILCSQTLLPHIKSCEIDLRAHVLPISDHKPVSKLNHCNKDFSSNSQEKNEETLWKYC